MKDINDNQTELLKTLSKVIDQWKTGENPASCSCYNEKIVELTKHLKKNTDEKAVQIIQYHLAELLDIVRTI